MAPRAVGEQQVEVGRVGVVRRDPRPERGHEGEEHDDEQRDDRHGPAQEPRARDPQAAGASARQRDGVDDAHETRIRGLRSEYATSTSRLATTYPSAATIT